MSAFRDDGPIDLSALDPTRNTARFNAVAARISREAMNARARRLASPPSVLVDLVAWARPALVAAAIVLAVAIPTLARGRATEHRTPATAADVMGIPPELMNLVQSPRTPSLFQIDAALASVAVGSR
jgi:hypothetical protein